tara:strand:+ start:147 stop:494 length:348 start_codon:yes stop_codon:yes gene_type:complete
MKLKLSILTIVLTLITMTPMLAFAGSGVEGVLKDISQDTTSIAAWMVGIYAFVFVIFLLTLYISFKINGRIDMQRALSYLAGVVLLLVCLTIFKDSYIPKLTETIEEIVQVKTSF